MAYAGVFAFAQEGFDGGDELGLGKVAGEGGTRVVGEDAKEHDCVVLDVGPGRVVFQVELFAEGGSRGARCGGGGFGRVNDGGEVENLRVRVGRGGATGGTECILGEGEGKC